MQSENEHQSTSWSEKAWSNHPAPLSRLLGLPVLTSDPTPLSSALSFPTLIEIVRDIVFGRPAPARAFSLGAAAVYSETSDSVEGAPLPGSSPKTSSGYAPPDAPWAKFSREDMYAGIVIAVMILGPLASAPHY